jgi:hypothetical protein
MVSLAMHGLSDLFLLAIVNQLSKSAITKLKKLGIFGLRWNEDVPSLPTLHNSLLGLGEFLGSAGASALEELELGNGSFAFRTMEGLISGLSQNANIKRLTFHPATVSPEAAQVLATSLCNAHLEGLTLSGETTIGNEECQVRLFRSLRCDTTLLKLRICTDLFDNGGADLIKGMLIHTSSLRDLQIEDYDRIDSDWIQTAASGLAQNSTVTSFKLALLETGNTPISLEPLWNILLSSPENKSKLERLEFHSDSLDDESVELLAMMMRHPQWRLRSLKLGGDFGDKKMTILFSEPQSFNLLLVCLEVIQFEALSEDVWRAIAESLPRLKLARIAIESYCSGWDDAECETTQDMLLRQLQLSTEIESADFYFEQPCMMYERFSAKLDAVCMRNVVMKGVQGLRSGKLTVGMIPQVLTCLQNRWPQHRDSLHATILHCLLLNRPCPEIIESAAAHFTNLSISSDDEVQSIN